MKRFLPQTLQVMLFLCMVAGANAQERRAQILQAKIASGYGSVTDLDGEVFKGKLTFNDNAGIVTVANDDESWSFTAKKAVAFEFDDATLSRHRTFHVLDYTEKETGFTEPAFFEVLGEFQAFAVLAKIDRVGARPAKGSMPWTNTSGGDHSKVAYQTETIFIMNDQGLLEPYLQLTERESEGVYFDMRTNRKKFIDEDLIQEYTGTLYPRLETFANENRLSFKKKEDLVKILEYYKQLQD